jgi:putative redox protein
MEIKSHISLIKTINKSPNLFTTSTVRGFQIDADEPLNHNGQNLAPTPFDLLNSALASCTSIYLRGICNKYKIDTGTISIRITITINEDKSFLFDRKIKLEKKIELEQKAFLLEQSNYSPTTVVLKKGNTIITSLND